MPYTKLKDANPAIQGIKPSVTLAQANLIAKWADAMEAAEDGPESPWAAAIAQFKKLYTVEGGKWVKKESTKAVSLSEAERRVRDAWYAKFQPSHEAVLPATSQRAWVKEVFEDKIILETSGGLLSYSYTITDEGVEFGEPVKVEVEYKPVESKALGYNTTVIAFGGAIKSLGGGHLGGYLVRFSDENAPDLTGDFFTKSTDFGFTESLTSPRYLNHTAPLATRDGKSVAVKKALGKGTLTIDDVGILTDAILFNREQYEKMLDSLGWSSGTAAHLVQRQPAGKAQHITRWPLGLDASLTPIPAEPSNVVVPFKSLFTPEVEPEPVTPEGGGNPPADTDEGPTEAQTPLQVGQIAAARMAAIKTAIEIGLLELEIMEV